MSQKQPTAKPTRKVTGAGFGGVAGIVLTAVLTWFGVDISPELGSVIAAAVAAVLGYLVPERGGA